jgi:UDP-N-acetylglucosamine 1-carboxyvinyltransferase
MCRIERAGGRVTDKAVPHAITVTGGRELGGHVETSGFKHSMVTCMAAACLGTASVRIDNCPAVDDAVVIGHLLCGLGADVSRNGPAVTIDPADLTAAELDPAKVGSVHGAVYLAPALLARFGSVAMPVSGGCQIGPAGGARPVDQYVSVLSRFGADAHVTADGGFAASATRLRATDMDLLDYTQDRALKSGPLYSGATKYAVLAAVAAKGTSVLRNPYPKPDVKDMVSLLVAMGADIETPSADVLVIHGGTDALRRSTTFGLCPDLIQVMTWLAVGLAHSPGGITIAGRGMHLTLDGLTPELNALRAMGADIEPVNDSSVLVRKPEVLRSADIVVASHGVYSDSQPFFVLLACLASGISRITETVWPDRFGYTAELNRMGTRLRQVAHAVTVQGPCVPNVPGLEVHAGDLRAAAALVIAALHVKGTSVVSGAHHLARGYADLPGQLRALGADISTTSSPSTYLKIQA